MKKIIYGADLRRMVISAAAAIEGNKQALAGGVALSGKLSNGENSEKDRFTRENNRLIEENEKIRKRLKDAERQVEDLIAANKRLRNEAKAIESDGDDMEDELSSAKIKVKSLTKQNEDLLRQLSEYKQVCASYEEQIKELKR